MTKEELEQEAEIYSYKLYHSKAWNPGEDMLVKAYLAGAEPREKRIEELEKENAELKKVKQVKIEVTRDYKKLAKDLQEQGNQLTKAKYHIKKLLDCLKQDTNDPQTNYYVCQYMDKAEQFLNSEVEK